MITVLLADDHPMFRRGLRSVLEESRAIEVIAEVGDGQLAIDTIAAQTPDVAVLDLDMPKKDGLEVVGDVGRLRLTTKLVLLTGHKSAALVQRVLDAGPLGFVLKDGAVTEIVECVRSVAAGKHYVSPQLSSALVARRMEAAALAERHEGIASLTPTERRVLALVAQGRSSKQIADELFISVRTVDHHRASIGGKLKLSGAHALVRFAIEHRSALI